jgi:hypothetical protein
MAFRRSEERHQHATNSRDKLSPEADAKNILSKSVIEELMKVFRKLFPTFCPSIEIHRRTCCTDVPVCKQSAESRREDFPDVPAPPVLR